MKASLVIMMIIVAVLAATTGFVAGMAVTAFHEGAVPWFAQNDAGWSSPVVLPGNVLPDFGVPIANGVVKSLKGCPGRKVYPSASFSIGEEGG